MKPKLKSFLLALLYTVGFCVIQMAVAAIGLLIASKSHQNVMQYMMQNMMMLTLIANLLILAGIILTVNLRKQKFSDVCGLRTVHLAAFLLPFLACAAFSFAWNMVLTIVPIPQFLMGKMGLVNDGVLDGKVVSILSAYLISPLVEELVFRGLVQTRLRMAMSAFWSVFLSALLFSAVHFMTGSVMTVIFTFMIGLVCALAYEKTGSILPAIVAHIVCNLCGMAPNLVASLSPIRQYLIIGALAVSFIVFLVLLLVKPSKMPSTSN